MIAILKADSNIAVLISSTICVVCTFRLMPSRQES